MEEIIDCDNHIIVAYKRAGILSQEDITHDPDMLTILKQYIKEKYNKPGDVFLGLVHRLDRNTSGVMVFARTSKAASRLFESMKNKEFNKCYLAIVEGRLNGSARLSDKLFYDEKQKKSFISPKGKEAILRYEAIDHKVINGREYTLVNIELETGRHHQIRCQMAHIGHPLLSDVKYGARLYEKNYFSLSSYHLSFMHPTLKEERSYYYFSGDKYFDKFYSAPDFLEHYKLIK